MVWTDEVEGYELMSLLMPVQLSGKKCRARDWPSYRCDSGVSQVQIDWMMVQLILIGDKDKDKSRVMNGG